MTKYILTSKLGFTHQPKKNQTAPGMMELGLVDSRFEPRVCLAKSFDMRFLKKESICNMVESNTRFGNTNYTGL